MNKKYYDSFAIMGVITDLMERIGNLPALDVVEVVRCKDCEYSYDSIGGWVCSHGPCVDCIVPEDFFCKYGKCKEGKE